MNGGGKPPKGPPTGSRKVRAVLLGGVQRHRDVVGVHVGHDQVGLAVRVHACARYGDGGDPCPEDPRVAQVAVARVLEHRNVVDGAVPGAGVGRGYVRVAVVVEVGLGQGVWATRGGVGALVGEPTIAAVLVDYDAVAKVRRRQVVVSVTVEVVGEDAVGAKATVPMGLPEGAVTVVE